MDSVEFRGAIMLEMLILAGLAVTPFILAPGRADLFREPKMAWALMFALATVLTALYQGSLKPFRNKWALILVGFGLISFYLSPNPKLLFFGIESGRFWSWEPLYQILVFLIFTIAVSSIKINFDRVFAVMVWCGTLMATFVILQALRLDQFFEWRWCDNGYMAGTLGNPTLVVPFLAMIVPIAIYKHKYIQCALMVIPAVLIRSDMAILSMVATLGAFLAFRSHRALIVGVVAGVAGLLVVAGLYATSPVLRETCPDNERFVTWRQSVIDLTSPVMRDSKKIYALTGIGPGSFKYLFHTKNNKTNDWFIHAHNDYVQTLYEQGLLGFGLFLAMLVGFFKDTLNTITARKRALFASLSGIMVSAFGLFVWQVGTHIFYTLVIVGLLNNRYIEEGV